MIRSAEDKYLEGSKLELLLQTSKVTTVWACDRFRDGLGGFSPQEELFLGERDRFVTIANGFGKGIEIQDGAV